MPTLLVNSRMAKPLAARIEKSLRGSPGAALAPRLVALFRIATVLGIVAATIFLVVLRRRDNEQLIASRGALLRAVTSQASSLTVEDQRTVVRAETWLRRLAGSYDGDVLDGALRAGALDKVLAQPLIYFRGPLDSFKTSAAMAEAEVASFKDAFLSCLAEPPRERSEKALLTKVRAAGSSDVVANAHRLWSAVVGLPFLSPAWLERVRTSDSVSDISELEHAFARAPIDEAKQAARARLFIAVLDEPGDTPGPSELDGERPHFVRIAIVDLATEKILLRQRRRVDPSWISLDRRAQYARRLDGCKLALDVRDAAASP